MTFRQMPSGAAAVEKTVLTERSPEVRGLVLTGVVVLLLVLLFPTAAFAGSGKWEYLGTEDGVRVSRMAVDGSDVLAFRSEMVADIAIGQLIAVFVDPNERKHWVDRYADHKVLDRTERSERYWIKFGLPFPVSDRDYVLQSDIEVDDAKRVFITRIKSVEDRRAPVNDCCVRATVHKTYYRFEPVPGSNKTRLIVEVHTDPKGLIPNWLVNRIQRDWPSTTLSGLVKRASRSGIKPHPHFANWHKEK